MAIDQTYYKMGDVTTTNHLTSPNTKNINAWYKEWKPLLDASVFDAYIVGNVAEKIFGKSIIPTVDFDVALLGDIAEDYESLKVLMDEAVRIGFDNKFLVDIFHNDALLDIQNFKPIVQIRQFNHFKRSNADGSNKKEYKVEGKDLEEIYGGMVKATYTNTDIIPVSCYKARARFKDGDYIGIQINVKDAFDADDNLLGKELI